MTTDSVEFTTTGRPVQVPAAVVAYLADPDHFDNVLERYTRFKVADDKRLQALESQQPDPDLLNHSDLELFKRRGFVPLLL